MKLSIDDRVVDVPPGATVLEAVNRLGVALPQLCKDPDRSPLGACRTCLVHVEGMRGTPAACHLPARDGMVISTTHPDVTPAGLDALHAVAGSLRIPVLAIGGVTEARIAECLAAGAAGYAAIRMFE